MARWLRHGSVPSDEDPQRRIGYRRYSGPAVGRRQFCKTLFGAAAGFSMAHLLASGCVRRRHRGSLNVSGVAGIPDIIRSARHVFLFENHNVAHLVWHASRIRNATVVHVDTHDDYRYVPERKQRAVRRLLDRADFAELFRMTDLTFAQAFQVRPADQLFDFGNFLYPCVEDGTLAALIWVVPDAELDAQRVAHLASHFQHVLRLSATPRVTQVATGRFTLNWEGPAELTLCTLDGLPAIPSGALLDLDVDFFSFPGALAEEHLPAAVSHDPAETCETLLARVPAPAVITVCSSVWGGYLPILFRFLADACFDFFASGQYPEYARILLDHVLALRRLMCPEKEPPEPNDASYRPAWLLTRGLTHLAKGRFDVGLQELEAGARLCAVYRKGLLDAAEAFLHMGFPGRAQEALDRFEQLTGSATTGSLAWRARALLATGDVREAEALARRLIAWDRQPFSLMLYGGVLTEQQRFREAQAVYAEVVRMAPNHAGAFYNLGVVAERQGRFEGAAEHYRQAIRFHPLFADAHENLGFLLLQKHEFPSAIEHLEQTVHLCPWKVKAWGNLGLAYAGAGQWHKAVVCHRRAVALNPNVAELRYFLAEALAHAGQSAEAEEECRAAIRLRPGWSAPYRLLSRLGVP